MSTKPAMIRSFFEKIEKASTAGLVAAPEQAIPAAAKVVVPTFIPTHIPMTSAYTDDCPPLTTRNSADTRAVFNDYGVGLPPMAGSF